MPPPPRRVERASAEAFRATTTPGAPLPLETPRAWLEQPDDASSATDWRRDSDNNGLSGGAGPLAPAGRRANSAEPGAEPSRPAAVADGGQHSSASGELDDVGLITEERAASEERAAPREASRDRGTGAGAPAQEGRARGDGREPDRARLPRSEPADLVAQDAGSRDMDARGSAEAIGPEDHGGGEPARGASARAAGSGASPATDEDEQGAEDAADPIERADQRALAHPAGAREPPPTRLGIEAAETGLALPAVHPVPDPPEPGIWPAARYAMQFVRARLQRRRVVRTLRAESRHDTASLDDELGSLGKRVRELGIERSILADENRAIDDAESRRDDADRACSELMTKQAEEKAKFAEIESEKQAKVTEAEEALDRVQRELASLEAQRRGLRDKRKSIDRQRKGYIKTAEDREAQAAKAELKESRESLHRAAKELRADAAGFDSELRDIERRLSAIETPLGEASARVDALKAELESVRRGLGDARESHRHRLAELEEERNRRDREVSQAGAEIQRHLVTLGTLVNLHRVEHDGLDDHYARIDRLRAAIGARSRAIDRLSAECEAYDRGSLARGAAALAGFGALVSALLALLWIIF